MRCRSDRRALDVPDYSLRAAKTEYFCFYFTYLKPKKLKLLTVITCLLITILFKIVRCLNKLIFVSIQMTKFLMVNSKYFERIWAVFHHQWKPIMSPIECNRIIIIEKQQFNHKIFWDLINQGPQNSAINIKKKLIIVIIFCLINENI